MFTCSSQVLQTLKYTWTTNKKETKRTGKSCALNWLIMGGKNYVSYGIWIGWNMGTATVYNMFRESLEEGGRSCLIWWFVIVFCVKMLLHWVRKEDAFLNRSAIDDLFPFGIWNQGRSVQDDWNAHGKSIEDVHQTTHRPCLFELMKALHFSVFVVHLVMRTVIAKCRWKVC